MRSIFPDGWKTARVKLTSTKGLKRLSCNYRYISILPVVSMVLLSYQSLNPRVLVAIQLNPGQAILLSTKETTADFLSYVIHLWQKSFELQRS